MRFGSVKLSIPGKAWRAHLRRQALAGESVLPVHDHFRVVNLDEANAVEHSLDAQLPVVPVIRPCRADNKETLAVESGETTEHTSDLVLADAAFDRDDGAAARRRPVSGDVLPTG